MVVERNGERLTLDYTPPGFTLQELQVRLLSQWWLAWLFWIVGVLTYLHVHPRDTRRRLLIAFFCVTALWLSASTLSRLHLWESAIVLRMAVWLSVPVYWHLHWVFPERLPALRRWPHARAFGYAVACVLAGLELLQVLPPSSYIAGFGLAFLGLLIPLIVRLFNRAQARQVRVLWGMLLIAVAPALVLTAFVGSGGSTLNALVALLGLPLLPIGYFYTAYRPQLGWLELRANRLIALFLFGLALSVLAALALPWLAQIAGGEILSVVGIVAAGVAAAAGFPAFQRWVERRLLNIPLPPRYLLGRFLASITTSLDRATLARVLHDEILPSLQITQSALALYLESGQLHWLYARQIALGELPDRAALAEWQRQAGHFRTPDEGETTWVRLALPLVVEEKTIGLWLLGRRDPDDIYTQAEIEYLQVLANQTALVLVTLMRTDELREFYRADIQQRESERIQLARDLHDVVLNSLGGLRHAIGLNPPPGFLDAYERAATNLRHIISDLRPPLLDQGLYYALKALAGEHEYRDDDPLPALEFGVSESGQRYELNVEEQIYRIVQQAYENALQHARAGALTFGGELLPGQIDLWLDDDGIGLVADRDHGRLHFGLRGMRERAALIGAELDVTTAQGGGTRVRVRWRAEVSERGL